MNTKIEDGESARLDLFAAHALQGLLASGKFTEPDECGQEWAIIHKVELYDEAGVETGRMVGRADAVELAWRMAEWMIKERPKTAQ